MQAKYVSSAIVLMLLCSCIFAQERKLTLKAEAKPDKSVEFKYEKTDPGTYTVVLELSNLQNSIADKKPLTAFSYSGRLTSISPISKSQDITYSYRYNYIRGKLNPKYDPGFIYLLPYPEGVHTQALETVFYRSLYFGDEAPEDWKAYRFYTAEPTNITAIRKGIVVEIVDEHENPEADGVTFTTTQNSLVIEHEDGTLAYYRGFQKGSFKVKMGDTVFPGTVLGLNTQLDQERGYYLSLMINYLKTIERDPSSNLIARSGRFYGFITPHFATAEGVKILEHGKEYQISAPHDIVKKEMNKREIKRWETGQ